MNERRVADYFIVAGLPENPKLLEEAAFSDGHKKNYHGQAPITDIGVIFPSLGEKLPEGFEAITRTPTGLNADLNHGSLRTIESYLCFRRGRDKPPLVDIGVMYEGKEHPMEDVEVVKESVGKHVANVNNSMSRTFITYRRGNITMPCNALVVTEICVVISSKGESPPHAFCCIHKNLNKGIVGSDVFMCYKKSMNRAKLLTYKPEVICRYPMNDLVDFPFPNSVPLFCLPMGASLELWPKEALRPKPVFSTFVLTVSDAKHKVYGSAITFYEKFPIEDLNEEQRHELSYSVDSNYELNVNKSICVLSHWPFSDAFESWLLFLYNIVTSNVPQSVPVERYILQLLDDVPFPAPRTLLQLSASDLSQRVIMTQPEDIPLPRSAAGFKQLLVNLGSENCLQVLLLVLTEQKILIHSLRPDTLTAVSEAISSLLFPFKWQCPYIPLCPLGLVEVLHAPLPFLIGLDSRFFDLYDPPPDVCCIDLDTNIITVAEHQRQLLNIKLLPKRAAKYLKTLLDSLVHKIHMNPECQQEHYSADNVELEFQRRKKQQAFEFEIQEAFLKFMVLTLKGYRSYLLPITKAPTVGTTDPQALFQLNDFLKSRDKAHHKFFNLMMKTQMFIRFIEESSFVADGDQGLSFFDECTDRLNEEGEISLIEHDGSHRSDRTIFVLPPEPTQTTSVLYTHFDLDPMLMLSKKRGRLSSVFSQSITPGSPMARRTKHEIKSAQKFARKCYPSPDLWAKCLSGTCHTLYFMVLPSMLSLSVGNETLILQQAYELLVRATRLRLSCDEVCYRLMMQLCGEHSRPLLAVKLLVLMKKFGIQPNALTYGLYNRCVLEAEWSRYSGSSQLWNKLRNVVLGAAQFRWAARRKAARNLSSSTEGGSSLLDPRDRAASHSSLDSHEAVYVDSILDKLRKSIFKGSLHGSQQSVEDTTDSSDHVDDDTTILAEQTLNNHFTPPDSPPESRILSRSESGSDANIIDKVHLNNKKNCAKSLQFNGNLDELDKNDYSEKMSPRIAVTENDPLGAFEVPVPPSITPPPEIIQPPLASLLTDEPILFRSSVHKSATFDGSPPSQNKLHRSETVPAATVASSLASLGSTFKLGFSRYSPSRLSLRKADLKKPQQFIENALTTLSPSSLTGKKSNELIQGGISSIKFAANTVVKKFDEIKEAISTSANSTPVKLSAIDRMGAGDTPDNECESIDGSEGGDRIRRISAELGSYRGSCTNLKDFDDPLPENLFQGLSEEHTGSQLDINLTSCSECHNCSCLLYDEDIMAHWSAEDSNLNTVCQVCSKPTVPFLTITVTGHTNLREPFSVPYLNPLVLRKELENIMCREGDLSIADAKFVDDHPIIYWNLVWAFERINVQTHLSNMYFKNKAEAEERKTAKYEHSVSPTDQENYSYRQPVEAGSDPLTQELPVQDQQVNVTCLWDQPRLHGNRLPMYILWDYKSSSPDKPSHYVISNAFMQQIISTIRVNNLQDSMKNLAMEREKFDGNKSNIATHSIYRDILFLACKVLGRNQVDLNVFDKEYMLAYTRLTERQNKNFAPQDKPICLNSLYCRQYFKPLTLP